MLGIKPRSLGRQLCIVVTITEFVTTLNIPIKIPSTFKSCLSFLTLDKLSFM